MNKFKKGDTIWFINGFRRKIIAEIVEVNNVSYKYKVKNFNIKEVREIPKAHLDKASVYYCLSNIFKKL